MTKFVSTFFSFLSMTLDIAQQNALAYDRYATNGLSFYNDNMIFPSNFYLSPLILLNFLFISLPLQVERWIFGITTMITKMTSSTFVPTTMARTTTLCWIRSHIHFREWSRTNQMCFIFFIRSSLFCSAMRRQKINSEYFLKPFS